ncbi:MAG: CTP synthase [Mycoplasma sp.]|nr:CTP synthase [Mycoplasma sp.]
MSTKYIFVTGGVLSGLGKGVSAASIGRLLKAKGYKVFVQKLDPYLNFDPGTMSPFEHGEVYVTADGAETDLDLGHYERFIGENFSKLSNFTSAQIFMKILEKERRGEYGGKTVQIIPHFTDEVEELIKKAGKESKAEFVITEIGGTVGDIESLAFLKSISFLGRKQPKDCFFIHTTYIPFLSASKEFKTKPSQFSMSRLHELAIQPNMILVRSTNPITNLVKEKISFTSYVDKDSVISVPDSSNIYKIPLNFEKQNVAEIIEDFFGLENKKPELDDWRLFVSKVDTLKKHNLEIGMIGKYIEFEDAYMSIIEALKISSHYLNAKINLKWIQSDNLTKENIEKNLEGLDGVMILPGFGKRGFQGKVIAAEYTREKDIPTFGICFGMQAMTVVQAIKKGIKDATSSEISETGTFVFDLIKGKNTKDSIGGTLRLGESKTSLKPGSQAAKIYGSNEVFERHRHRYEVNSKYIDQIEDDKFSFSGYDKETNLVEICELKDKKFYLGVQYHPEFTARPLKPNPLFSAFIEAIIKNIK